MRGRLFIIAAAMAAAAAPGTAHAQAPAPADLFGPLGAAGVQPAITSVPYNRYLPETVAVVRSNGLKYVNLDIARHDVVALDDFRADDSAPWCAAYEDPFDPDAAQNCPLFWSRLIPGGGSETQVLGLEDAEAGRSYRFYCSIHPTMVGTIEVVG